MRDWAAVLAERGVAALLEAITTGTALPRRLLARTDGERTLTDLRHVAQALHAAAGAGHLGPAALIDWLRHRIDEAAVDVGPERSRRLESDAAAVQIITIHRSKGLEFPIVYLPFGWDRNVRDPEVPLLHDEAGRRVLDVGGETGEGWKERCARHRAEEAGEDLRLLYVALTRAQCQVVAWWAPATTAATSPVHRLLLGRAPGGTPPGAVFEPAERYRVPTDTAAAVALRSWAGPDIAVESVGPAPTPPAAVAAGAGPTGPLRAAAFSPGAGHPLAAHLVLGADRRRRATTARGEQRARGARHRRRAGRGTDPGGADRRGARARAGAGPRGRPAVAAGRVPARSRVRHAGARRAARSPTSPPPTCRPS